MIHKATKQIPAVSVALSVFCAGYHKSLLHLRQVIVLETHLLAWRRHVLSCNALRSLHVASHLSACGLSNVHCSVHYEVDATAHATSIYGRSMAAYTLLSGHVQSAAYLLPYLYI